MIRLRSELRTWHETGIHKGGHAAEQTKATGVYGNVSIILDNLFQP